MEPRIDRIMGLLNRAAWLQALEDNLRRGVPFGVAFIDLDNFARFNFHYTHGVGDKVLAAIGLALLGLGLAGRFGGDELMLLVENDDVITRVTQAHEAVTRELRPYETLPFRASCTHLDQEARDNPHKPLLGCTALLI